MSLRRSGSLTLAVAVLLAVGTLIITAKEPDPRLRGRLSNANPLDPDDVTDCSKFGPVPADLTGEVNTSFDPVSEKLSISWYDHGLGANRALIIRYKDPACLAIPELKGIIESNIQGYEEGLAMKCASLKLRVEEAERTGVAPTVRGVPLNLEAARKVLRYECPTPTP